METARSQSKSKAVSNAERLVEETMAGRDASHDAAHAFRVRDLALSLASEEGIGRDPTSATDDTLEIVELAALLHDIGDYKYTKGSIEDTSIVEHFLEEEGLEESKRERILSIIKGMGKRFSSDSKTKFRKQHLLHPWLNLELKDADRLDAIGAIGIARCFTYGGSVKQILHDPSIPPRQSLSKEKYMNKDGKQTAINHFYEKLFKLKDLMKTEAGKRRAEKRHKFMQDFLKEFYDEWEGKA